MKTIYTLIFFLLTFSVFAQDVQQQKLQFMLSEIKKPKGEGEIPFVFTRQDYDDNLIKQRILDLLMNKWSEAEISAWIEQDIDDEYYKSYREINAQKINKYKKMPYEKVLDSIRSIQIEEIKKLVADKPVSNKIIFLVSWLDMEGAIPILKNALQDPKHYDKEAVELSLARLRVEPFHTDLVRKLSGKKKIKNDVQDDFWYKAYRLLFIASPEATNAVIKDWLFRDDKVQPYADDPLTIPIANYLALELVDFIQDKDFQKKYPDDYFISPASITREQLNGVRQWVKQNKNKIQPNRDYFNLYRSGVQGL